MNKTLMIYGATGYTGRLIAANAVARGVPVVLAGRGEHALRQMSRELDVPYVVANVDDAASLDEALARAAVLLNCAGPFARTAEALMEAAMRARVHYIDTSAELSTYQLAEKLGSRAESAGVMLMPGGGGSVAMLGCLAAAAIDAGVRPARIRLALQVSGSMSRGSAISAAEGISVTTLARRDGVLVAKDAGDLSTFDFGDGPVECFPVTLPDLVTVWHSTGAPDIETYVHVTGAAFPATDLDALPDGPSEDEREANRYRAVAEVTRADGRLSVARLETVNGYTFTALAVVEAGRRVLNGEYRAGYRTPVELFGEHFAETIADTTVVVATNG